MVYEEDDPNIDYMFKVEQLLSRGDVPFSDKLFIAERHSELRQTVNSNIMNSGWRKLYKFITDSVHDERLQAHITESLNKLRGPPGMPGSHSPNTPGKKKKLNKSILSNKNQTSYSKNMSAQRSSHNGESTRRAKEISLKSPSFTAYMKEHKTMESENSFKLVSLPIDVNTTQ